jgi:hypothetical protein
MLNLRASRGKNCAPAARQQQPILNEKFVFGLLMLWILSFLTYDAIQVHSILAVQTYQTEVVPARTTTTSYSSILVPSSRDGLTTALPDAPLYIITPCSRPDFLPRVRKTLDNNHPWIWIIVYTSKPTTWTFPDEASIYEVWPGIKTSDRNAPDEPQTFGNPERNFGISLVQRPESYVYFLDDDNGVHPEFWRSIYPLLSLQATHDFITFDQERVPGWVFPGPQAMLYRIDTAMYVTRRRLIADTRWRTLRYNADGFFAEAMAAQAQHRLYVNCTCSYYNFFKQNFTTPWLPTAE